MAMLAFLDQHSPLTQVKRSQTEPRPSSQPRGASVQSSLELGRPAPCRAGGAEPLSNITAGCRVRVVGLASQPELNGCEGIAIEWDAPQGRWRVLMDSGLGKLLRPGQLQAVPPAPLPAAVPQAAQSVTSTWAWPVAATGCPPCAADHDPAMDAPTIGYESTSCDDPDYARASVQQPVLGPGQLVRVGGLNSRLELNGKLGTIVEWDGIEGWWLLRMEDGAGKAFRPSNLEVVTLAAPGQALPSPVYLSPGSNSFPSPRSPVRNSRSRSPEKVRHVRQNQLYPTLLPGQRVVVTGLKARPELNGQLGAIVEYDETQGRWRVGMHDGSAKLFRRENLQHLETPVAASSGAVRESPTSAASPSRRLERNREKPAATSLGVGSRVCLLGPRLRPSASESLGTVLRWSEDLQQWEVVLDDGTRKMVRSEHLKVHSPARQPAVQRAVGSDLVVPGSKVEICNVKNRPELNGLFGVVEHWDAEELRWQVQMSDGSRKLCRPANLQAISLSSELDEGSHEEEIKDVPTVRPQVARSPSPQEAAASKAPRALKPQRFLEASSAGEQAEPREAQWEEEPGSGCEAAMSSAAAAAAATEELTEGEGSMRAAEPEVTRKGQAEERPSSECAATEAQQDDDDDEHGAETTAQASEPEALVPAEDGSVATPRELTQREDPEDHLPDSGGPLSPWSPAEEQALSSSAASPTALSPASADSSEQLKAASSMAATLKPERHPALSFGVRVESMTPEFFNAKMQQTYCEEIAQNLHCDRVDIVDIRGEEASMVIDTNAVGFVDESWARAAAHKVFHNQALTSSTCMGPEHSICRKPQLVSLAHRASPWLLQQIRKHSKATTPKLHTQPAAEEPRQFARASLISADKGSEARLSQLTSGSSTLPPPAAAAAGGSGGVRQEKPVNSACARSGLCRILSADVRDDPYDISVGAKVRIQGLRRAPELNGVLGTVCGWEDSEQRWMVLLVENGEKKLLKELNLEVVVRRAPAPASSTAAGSGAYPSQDVSREQLLRATSDGESSGGELRGNGLTTPPSPQPDRRDAAAAAAAQADSSSPRAVRLGDQVSIHGLLQQQGLNGMKGTCMGQHTDGRWKVAVEDGSKMLLRMENLRMDSRAGTCSEGEGLELVEASAPEDDRPGEKSLRLGQTCVIVGFATRPDLNGLIGTICCDAADAEGRWKFKSDAGRKLKILSSNLSPVDE
eukprot:TRINITY_DN17603_c0_g1_i2.p1 TRINITY_DN17603_c0_g1~~TRINITY_DN17603_c0_g1_i2.p1  ORF type:complete len:1200 (+),score=276.52 TRINITY_DN17603_c0_g1_i2:156-3755(+)